jgi:hypothetical protein
MLPRYALSTEQGLATLRDLFRNLLAGGHGQRAKELRNEVLIVASFVARQPRSHALFRGTGWLHLLLAYATAGETNTPPPSSPRRDEPLSAALSSAPARPGSGHTQSSVHVADLHHFATSQPVDLELKRLLWALLSDLSRSDALNLSLVVASPLLHVLLAYLNVDLQLTPATAFATVAALSKRGNGGRAPGTDKNPHQALEGNDEFGDDGGGGGGGGNAFAPGQEEEGRGGSRYGRGGSNAGAAAATAGSSVTPLSVRRLPRAQLRVLQQQAMSVLLNLAPRAPAAFRQLAGHVIALRFLDACSESRGEEMGGLVEGALMLLLSFVGLPGLQEELGQLDAVRWRGAGPAQS